MSSTHTVSKIRERDRDRDRVCVCDDTGKERSILGWTKSKPSIVLNSVVRYKETYKG
jgi:hypothetical protein